MHPEALTEQGKQIFPQLSRFPEFYLAGGTALALQIGHRLSADFHLFSDQKIKETLLPEAERVFVNFPRSVSVNNPDELTVFVGGTKITFLFYPFPANLEPVLYEGVKLLAVKEIAATKAYTIGRRGSYKDYIDLYFIISERHTTLEEIIDDAEKKYHSEFNARLFLEQLVYLDDIEDTAIEFLDENPIDKITLERFFINEIKNVTL